MSSIDAIPLNSFVRDQVGPSYRDLRPLKDETSTTFPVYPDLNEALVDTPSQDQPAAHIAHALAVCAGYAYSDAGTVSMMMTRLGLENTHCREIARSVDAMFIRSTAFVVQSADGRTVILCYRGTPPLDLISWLLAADVILQAPGRVSPSRDAAASGPAMPGALDEELHPGFYRNVRSTRPEVVRALERAMDGASVLEGDVDRSFAHVPADREGRRAPAIQPLEALYITGHSLGGAMAAVMTAMLVKTEAYRGIADKVRGVYTFGQPMVATPTFATSADRRLRELGIPLIRYVYRDDPVPNLPPSYTGEYKHFGEERRYVTAWPDRPSPSSTQSPPYRLDLATSFAAASLRKIAPFRSVPFTKNLEHHYPLAYISSLQPPDRPTEFGD
jgi:hypothetical protein